MSLLVLSTSLHPTSRSRILCRACLAALETRGAEVAFADLRDFPLPMCDGDSAYGDPNVRRIADLIRRASAILVGVPVYNYDVNAALKNALELTGSAWTGKIVGFLCAAGGGTSYMSVMSFANSLMLDFRCFIIPRFVYAEGDDFDGDTIRTADIQHRVDELAGTALGLAAALRDIVPRG